MSSLDEECDITTDACQEYQQKMSELEQVRGHPRARRGGDDDPVMDLYNISLLNEHDDSYVCVKRSVMIKRH